MNVSCLSEISAQREKIQKELAQVKAQVLRLAQEKAEVIVELEEVKSERRSHPSSHGFHSGSPAGGR